MSAGASSEDEESADALVVGAGPAGLAAAWGLRARGARVLLVDAGAPLEERSRTDEGSVLRGVGGAGLYSDGKFSFRPAGTAVWALRERAALERSYERLGALLGAIGVEAPPFGAGSATGEGGRVEGRAGWHCKRYPSRYAGIAAREALTRTLFGAPRDARLHTRLTALAYDEATRVHTAALASASRVTLVRAPRVVLAGGRFAPRSLPRGAHPSRFSRVEVGVRVEAPSAHPFFAALDGVDPKWLFASRDGGEPSLRTFCLCRDGEVLRGRFDGVQSVSGRADGPATGRSNLGLLVRWAGPCDASRAALEGALSLGASPAVPVSLAHVRAQGPGALAGLVRGAEVPVYEALEALGAGFPALREQSDRVLVHGPCIEGLGRYPACDDDLALALGVRVAGDGSGLFRGLVPALLSGLYVAERSAESP